MLAHALDEAAMAGLDPADFSAEWKWDGIRIQAAAGVHEDGRPAVRLYSRTGEDISGAFPELVEALTVHGALDGELLIRREDRVQSFNVLQQRLNRKAVTPKLLLDFPAHIRAYDLLVDGDEDIRALPFTGAPRAAGAFVAKLDHDRIDISPLVPFATWQELAAARADPASAGAGADAAAVEGVMLKRRDGAYVPGRPRGPWWKWKRDSMIVDAVLMYAQRGHGRRSSFYSDYTFGVWTAGADGDELVPVGKAYFGFTDEELKEIDRFVRRHTIGPVRAGARGGPWPRPGAGVRGRLRGPATLDAAPLGAGDALSPHQPAALGQAAEGGRPAGNVGKDAGGPGNAGPRGTGAGDTGGCRIVRSALEGSAGFAAKIRSVPWPTASTGSSAARFWACSCGSCCCRS